MPRLIASLFFFFAFAGASAAETSAVSGFTAVEAEGRFRVEVAHGSDYSVNMTGAEAGRVSMRVRGGKLRLWQTDQNWLSGGGGMLDALVRVTTPRLSEVKATRGAQVQAAAPRAGTFAAEASMGGMLTVAGGCDLLNVKASMGGQVNAREFRCANVHAEASMGGQVDAQARESVEASASMGGQVEVTGDPPRRSSRTSMGGQVDIE